jgi:hypothetical protein
MVGTRRLATAALFGALIAVAKGPLFPPPTGDLLVFVEALLLGLGFILLGTGGATFTALVAGALINIAEPGFWLFPVLLAFLYGAQVDAFSTAFRVRSGVGISARRMVLSLALSSATTGPIAYYATVSAGVVSPSPVDFYLFLIAFGVVSGAAGGFFAVRIWERNLKSWFAAGNPAVRATPQEAA